MAKIKILIDTDIFIDALKGIKSAKELFRTKDLEIYCSKVLSKRRTFYQKSALRIPREKDSEYVIRD